MSAKTSLAIGLALGMSIAMAAPSFAQSGPPGPKTDAPPNMMGPGMGGGPMMGMGGQRMGPGMEQRRARWANVTPEQREAFISMRVANMKAALKLTPEQEKLWPPVEAVIRDSAKTMAERAQQRLTQAPPADPIAALRMRAESIAARAAVMLRMADAAQPLYASLSDEQKARVPYILHGFGRKGGPAMRMMREGWDGHHNWGWMREHHRRWWNRD